VSDERVEKLAQKYHLELDELLHFRTTVIFCALLPTYTTLSLDYSGQSS
jgi:hypothetical protein